MVICILTWKSLHIFMGIDHSSNTKTLHEHDNNCQICHSTASLTRINCAEAERRLRLEGSRARGKYRGAYDFLYPLKADLLHEFAFRTVFGFSVLSAAHLRSAVCFYEKQN